MNIPRLAFLITAICLTSWPGVVTANFNASLAGASPQPAPPPQITASRLRGTFIQYWEDLMDEAAWRNVMDALVKADMHHVIILQHLEFRVGGNEYKYYPPSPDDFDPTRFILDYADGRKDMQIYIGLREDKQFQDTTKWDNTDEYAKTLNKPGGEADRNKKLADEAWKRYGKGKDGKMRPSFAGWYLPNEMWNQNYTEVQMAELRRFHRTISDHCKRLGKSNKPVAVCPYFNPDLGTPTHYLGPSEFATKFGEFLRPSTGRENAGVDIVMLQDGAGERRLTVDKVSGTIEPYYKSFREMSRLKNVKFWANVESWEYSPGYWPTGIDRLARQIEVTAPLADLVVTFDFFHYMNPYGHFHQGEWHEAEKKLYWCYIRKFVPESVKPGDPACPAEAPAPQPSSKS